jgi:hypothetical protein
MPHPKTAELTRRLFTRKLKIENPEPVQVSKHRPGDVIALATSGTASLPYGLMSSINSRFGYKPPVFNWPSENPPSWDRTLLDWQFKQHHIAYATGVAGRRTVTFLTISPDEDLSRPEIASYWERGLERLKEFGKGDYNIPLYSVCRLFGPHPDAEAGIQQLVDPLGVLMAHSLRDFLNWYVRKGGIEEESFREWLVAHLTVRPPEDWSGEETKSEGGLEQEGWKESVQSVLEEWDGKANIVQVIDETLVKINTINQLLGLEELDLEALPHNEEWRVCHEALSALGQYKEKIKELQHRLTEY